jgi:xanthine dehydrogenase accessory factor
MGIRLYQQLAQVLSQGAAVLATVITTQGSVPREVGAKMVIAASGESFNTIGGGAGEAKVIVQAHRVLETGQPQVVDIDLAGRPHQPVEGICGGRMRVWLACWSGDRASALVQDILMHLRSGQAVTLVTPLLPDHVPYLLPRFNSSDPNAGEPAFVETLSPPPVLLIVGAGHVGEHLAQCAHWLGFQVVIQDDRPEWANAQRYPQADLICTEPLAQLLPQLATHSQLYVALVTRGYQYDLDTLHCLLQRDRPCVYIGMIGSVKRVQHVYQALEQRGISRQQLQEIYAPIGLDLGALTPAEIAVSICAELVLAQRGGTGRPLSQVSRVVIPSRPD